MFIVKIRAQKLVFDGASRSRGGIEYRTLEVMHVAKYNDLDSQNTSRVTEHDATDIEILNKSKL